MRADDKNAAYDEDDKELADAMNSSLVKDDEIAAVKTTPVNKEDIKKIEPENIPLEIVWEDENMAVINKPSGMLTHPTPLET